jgi:acyl carrier protein
MNTEEASAAVVAALARIAPEADLDEVDAGGDLRSEIDLDSMDFLGLVEALAESTGVDIPEDDYREVRSLDGLVAYLVRRAA